MLDEAYQIVYYDLVEQLEEARGRIDELESFIAAQYYLEQDEMDTE